MRKPAPSSVNVLEDLEPLPGIAVRWPLRRGSGNRHRRAAWSGRPGRAAGRAGPGRSVSARLTIRVLALGMSRPDSMMVVQSSTLHLAVHEVEHHLLQLLLLHLAVADGDLRLRHELAGGARPWPRSICTRLWTKKTCPPRRSSRSIASRISSSLKRATKVLMASRSTGGVSMMERSRMPDQRHVEGPRDRRGGQGQDVDHRPELLEPLLVRHAEALLLVDDQQPEVLEADILLQQPVGADDDVDLPLLRPRSRIAFCSLAVRNRESISTLTG